MKKILKHITLLLGCVCVFALSGCFKEIELDQPEEESKLVLNAIFSPDSTWAANLSQSVGVFDENRPEFIEDATVEVFDLATDQLIVSMTSRPLGEYDAIGAQPEIGKSYVLRASAPGFESIEAISSIPEPAQILSVSWEDTVVWNRAPEPEGLVTIEFQDDPNEENYYFITLAKADTAASFSDTIIFFRPIPIYSHDPTVEGDFQEGALLSDQFFNGKRRTVNLNMSPEYLREGENVWCFVGTISRDFYWYRRTMDEQENNWIDPFLQPVELHSNVTGGLGIFAGYSLDSVFVK